MEKEDIRIRKVIMHILDTQTGQAIYSDTEMDAAGSNRAAGTVWTWK